MLEPILVYFGVFWLYFGHICSYSQVRDHRVAKAGERRRSFR